MYMFQLKRGGFAFEIHLEMRFVVGWRQLFSMHFQMARLRKKTHTHTRMAEDEDEEEVKTKEYTSYNRMEFECERDSHAFFSLA